MKGNDTRASIIRIGAEIIGYGGFNATGIEQVLKKAKVPKGSFYYYFSSKDDFGLAVIDAGAREIAESMDRFLLDEAHPPLRRIRRYFESVVKQNADSQCRRGCLIGNLGQELASQNEKFRKRLDEVFRSWQAQFARCLDEAKARGELARDTDTGQLAQFLLIGWEGAILRAKVQKSIQPIETFIETVFGRVLQ